MSVIPSRARLNSNNASRFLSRQLYSSTTLLNYTSVHSGCKVHFHPSLSPTLLFSFFFPKGLVLKYSCREGGRWEVRRREGRKKRYNLWLSKTYILNMIGFHTDAFTLCRVCNTMLVMLAPLVWSEVSTTMITLQRFTWKHTRTTTLC